MLIKTQVKRRTQTINNYILQVRQKVYDRRFRQAIEILRNSKESINNSYMAPYDPNSYLLDSLKTKHQKLIKQKQVIQMMVRQKLQDINKVKIRRGYSLQFSQTQNGYHHDESQFFQKMCAQEVGAYASRLTLRLEDVQKIDYEAVTLQTDYHVLRIILDQTITNIPYKNITSMEAEDLYVLLSWRGEKNNHNYMIIKFQHEEQRKVWYRCFTFSRLICQSELRDRLFTKPQQYNINIKPQIPSQKEQEDQAIIKELFQKPNNSSSKQVNLNISTNRSSAYDRLRRKSQYAPAGLINRSKSRKVSQDLTLKQGLAKNNYFYQKKLAVNKSQKSFDDQLSLSNSNRTKKQENKKEGKKNEVSNSKILKMIEEREKLQLDLKQGSNTQSNRQIFFNQSSIHWIEQENDQQKSKSSVNSKNIQGGGGKNILTLDIFHKEGGVDQSEHISEAPAQIQESPLLPHNLREKRRNQRNKVGMFQVQMKEVPNSPGYQNSLNSEQKGAKNKENSQNSASASKSRRGSSSAKKGRNQFQNQMDQQQENGDSVNDESNYQSIPKDKKPNKSEIQDKSQDLMSENQVSETQSRKYGLDDLKFGIVVLKCSASGWKQHIKKLHLSNNDMQLCWKNLKGDDLKKINILDIEKIQYMVITPGISKHIKNISNKRCMAIKYRTKDQFKMLQFYLPEDQDVQNMVNFYEKFKSYFIYKKNQDS